MNTQEKKDVTIIVNGQPHEVAKGKITYAAVVTLAYPDYPEHPERNYSVKYRRNESSKAEILPKGGEVEVTDNMIFNVDPTGQS